MMYLISSVDLGQWLVAVQRRAPGNPVEHIRRCPHTAENNLQEVTSTMTSFNKNEGLAS
jgi:hypothetical protein